MSASAIASLRVHRPETCLGDAPAEAIRAGSEDALDLVYRRYVPYVLSILDGGFTFTSKNGQRRFVRVRSLFDAEELCQDVFRAFFEQVEKGNFDAERPIEPYLRRIAVNLALKYIGKRSREVLTDELADEPVEPTDHVEDAEARRLYLEFRDTLDKKQREILTDYYESEGRTSQAAIGERMGLSRDQVYRSLTSIRKKALEFFGDRGWFK